MTDWRDPSSRFYSRCRLFLRSITGLLVGGCLVACSPIKSSYLRGDYASVDRLQVKRIKVTVAPFPGQRKDLGDLWVAIASNHITQKKNFLVKETVSLQDKGDLKHHCKPGIEGWLHLLPRVEQRGQSVEVQVQATLLRCRDGQPIWNTTAVGVWASQDANLKALTESYGKKFGNAVESFVAPSCHLLFAVIENLPNPTLNDADILEKIQMGG